jgi:hypothetical protein
LASLAPLHRHLLELSLVAALFASLAGTVVSALAILPLPFTIGSAACSLLLIGQFRDGS